MDDVSVVIRLVREVSDLWDDPRAWREQLLHGACRLLNGHVGLMLADYQPEAGWFGSLGVSAVVGLPPSMQALIQPAFAQMNQRQFEDVADNLLPPVKTVQQQME